jgi:hypothetical protein
MRDQYLECNFIILLTPQNSNSDVIPNELDGMVDEEDILTVDS